MKLDTGWERGRDNIRSRIASLPPESESGQRSEIRMSATLEATAGLFARYESEIAALETKQRAAEQNLRTLHKTEQELTSSVADLMGELQRTRAEVEASQERAKAICADAHCDANSIRIGAQRDADGLRKKGLAAVEPAQRAFQGLD